MKRRTLLGQLLCGFGGSILAAVSPSNADEATSRFELDLSWPVDFPGPLAEPCQVAGVAVSDDDRVFVLNRGENHWMPTTGFRKERIQKPAVLVFDQNQGKLLDSWGENLFVMPHQISIDRSGNIWIVDCGQDKVFKFDHEGSPLLELGGPEIGFRKPTDVVVLRDDSFVVSDGYTNSRIVHFSRKGQIIHQWGQKGKQPVEFQTPHSVACDENNLIYVADRENHRVQVLNLQGQVEAIWTNVERPLTIRYAAGSFFVLSNLEADRGIVRQLNHQGEVLSSFKTKPSETSLDFEWPHGLAVSKDGSEIIIGFTLTGRRVHRYRRVSA